jgi:hypothetical protein
MYEDTMVDVRPNVCWVGQGAGVCGPYTAAVSECGGRHHRPARPRLHGAWDVGQADQMARSKWGHIWYLTVAGGNEYIMDSHPYVGMLELLIHHVYDMSYISYIYIYYAFLVHF